MSRKNFLFPKTSADIQINQPIILLLPMWLNIFIRAEKERDLISKLELDKNSVSPL